MFINKSFCEEQTKWRKENLKTWSEEAIDTLINCFQSSKCIWNITSGDYKDQIRKFLLLEEFDMSVQECDINSMTIKNWSNLRGQFLLFS